MIFHQQIRVYPLLFGYCDTKQEWMRFLRGSENRGAAMLWDGSEGTTDAMLVRNLSEGWLMVLMSERAMRKPLPYVAGVLAHECRHAVDRIHEWCREERIGFESAAYMTEWMMDLCMWAYLRSMERRRWRVRLK